MPFLLFVLLVLAGGFLWLERDYIRDQIVLRGYTPAANVAVLADDTKMSEYGRRLFFVNHPTLDDKTALNEHCKNILEEAAVLGCYRGDRGGIYIYDVTDDRLKGIEEVTAAHEMLHQAYDRLDDKEKARVNALLQDYADNGLTDESVRGKLDIYRKSEPNNLLNEMHSLFGSEIADLPPELEAYYARYFTDRKAVLAYRQQSVAAFDTYRQQLASYDSRLEAMKAQLDADEADLARRNGELAQMRSQMNAYLAAENVSQYNSMVPVYNSLVNEYNAKLAATNTLVEQYNTLVRERNEIAIQAKSLNDAIDSHLPE